MSRTWPTKILPASTWREDPFRKDIAAVPDKIAFTIRPLVFIPNTNRVHVLKRAFLGIFCGLDD
jgi:hypothetical protein